MKRETAIAQAVRIAGGQSALAKSCKVTPQAVQQWLINGPPPVRCLAIEKRTGVSRYRLRPDVFGKAEAA